MTRESRAMMYKFFSLAFSHPTRECMEEMDKVIDVLATKYSIILDRLDVNKLYLQLKEEEEKLPSECVRILGPRESEVALCDPFERNYISMDADKILSQLKEKYEKVGFSSNSEYLDHISTELSFAHYVLTSDKIEEERRNSILAEFLKDHVLKWFKDFASCIESNTNLEFYKLTARTLLKFLEAEREYLGIK